MLSSVNITATNGAEFRIELSDCERYWLSTITTPSGRERYRVYSDVQEAIGAGLKWTRYQGASTSSGDETDGTQ